ncbi:biofilm formation regulator HmsP [Erwinia oleae]|uniref:biofilm formation regulator HmsP n=1 Tax=Erwinia oleae TaxID=796334 RepID=UPI000552B2C9|nr:biofilm formation regulator HmsP [Erwinia oleae]
MQVSRSLTIKQMATVSGVAAVTISVFIVIQLFHFVQQRRIDYAQQMENVAHTVRQPLSQAVLRADITQAERILNSLKPAGILGRAEVVLPGGLQALHTDFEPSRPVPRLIAKVFKLPVQITVPLYSLEPANPKPMALLILQADSWRVYQFILSALSTMVTTYLLLALILSVAISWCINKLMVRPLRRIANELHHLEPHEILPHQLALPRRHRDDELGMLIRSYNRNQQLAASVQQQASRQSTRYVVTDLPNKTLFLALLEQYLGGDAREGFSVLVLRIETLQEISGVVPDEQRDALMLALLERLKNGLSDDVQIGQLSVSDFALLMKRASNPFRAMRLARQLLQRLTQPIALQQMYLRPHVSIGLSQLAEGPLTAPEYLNRASSAMMSARQQGKNQILFFDAAMMARAHKRLTQEHDILQGLADGQFALFLQPQLDMNSGRLAGAEALLRMKQPDGSWSLPEDLIANAEELGIIDALGRWVFEESCRVLAEWQTQSIELPLSVNLSAVQLREPSMVTHLQNLIEQHGIRPGSLIVEITETAQIGEPELARRLLSELQAVGVSVALDDFGMGYANLNWLSQFKSLPISKLKMDRSFVRVLPDDDTMVRIIVAIAEIIKLDVIAEGVETEEQREWLLARGVRIGQGFLYSGALPIAEFNKTFLSVQ